MKRALSGVRPFLALVLAGAILASSVTGCSPGPEVTAVASATAVASPAGRQVKAQASVSIVPRQPRGTEPIVSRIILSPPDATVGAGQKVIFTAVALDASGKPVAQGALRWTVVSGAGSIDGNGVFTAGAVYGQFENAVSVESVLPQGTVRSFASVSIIDPQQQAAGPLETLAVYPPSVNARPGQVIGLGAVGWDSRSRFIPNLQLQWRMRTPAAGRIDQLGFFTATGSAGSYPDAVELVAVQQGATGRVEQRALLSVVISEAVRIGVLEQVVVVPRQVFLRPGQPLSFVARGFDQTGQRLEGLDFEWEVSNPDAGHLSQPGNFVAGRKLGTYSQAIVVVGKQKTAQGTVSASATVAVTVAEEKGPEPAGVLAAAQVVPGTVTLRPGERFVFTARALDASGKTVAARPSWKANNAAVGSFEQSGVFRASRTPGIYKDAILLELEQDRGGVLVKAVAYATVNIVGPLDRIEVVPGQGTVETGQTLRFAARGYDSLGLQVTGLSLAWKLENQEAGTIDQSGLFTAGSKPGNFESVISVTAYQADNG